MRVTVNPELLSWARERAGLETDQLLKRFPKFNDWLRGKLEPTLKQLEAFAKIVHVPIGYLFLDTPPQELLPVPDFRTMAQVAQQHASSDLLDTLYLCQQRQEWYRDHMRMHGETDLSFVESAVIDEDVKRTAADIRHILAFDLRERQNLPSWAEALRRFVEQVEAVGILVMVSGVVGSNNKRKLDPEEFRGFALVDELAPLIFINGADTRAAQMFTLAHELAHIWLGKSGVSDAQAAIIPDNKVEYWCNAVAAEVLAPLASVKQTYQAEAELQYEIQRLARVFKVSSLVVLRRLFDIGAINQELLWRTYREELVRLRSLQRSGSGGGDFYRTLGVRVSKRFARAVVGSTLEGQTLFRDAFRMLGIKKPATFYQAARELGVSE